MKKILTISVAAYNIEKFIKETIESLLKEDVMDQIEVLIIDDGSTDSTAEIAGNYVEKYPEMIRLIKKENGGWGSTVNAGIEQASGKYFKLLDGDDKFFTENMTLFIKTLEQTESDMILSPFCLMNDNTREVTEIISYHCTQAAAACYSYKDLNCNFGMQMHMITMKTKILQDNHIKITEHCFYSDVEYAIKAFHFVETIEEFNMPVYCYRIALEEQSISRKGFEKHYNDHRKVLENLLEYTEKFVADKKKGEIIYSRLLQMVQTQYCAFLCVKPDRTHRREFREFNHWLKKNYRRYYQNCKLKKIKALRLTFFWGYPLIARFYKEQITQNALSR